MIKQGDVRYNKIPLVVPSMAPHNVIVSIGDMLKTQLCEAGRSGIEIIGEMDKPLERVCHPSELKRDVAIHHKGTSAIKDKERLARFFEATGREL